MSSSDRETAVLDAVATLVDSLLDEFDVVDLLVRLTESCVELLDVDSAALLLAGPGGVLRVMTATSRRTEALELFQLQADQGPCLDCFATGGTVVVGDLREAADRWPEFAPAATEAGFRSVHAVPMRAAGAVIGSLGLFGTSVGDLDASDLLLGQTLAHVATVAILQQDGPTPAGVATRLRAALTQQVVVEQAKGFLFERLGVPLDDAFALLRGYAQGHGIRLSDLSRALLHDPQRQAEIVAALAAQAERAR